MLSGPWSLGALPYPCTASVAGVAEVRSWFSKSENGHPCPGLERFAAVTNCRRALEEEQDHSGLPPKISALVRSFCYELTFRQKTPTSPFGALPREELVHIGTQAGLFDGLPETLAYLQQTYAADPERRAIMEEVRKFYIKALARMQACGTARKAWAEGPSEIQWWEMLHQIRALVAHEASAPEELAGVDESTPLEEVEARIMRKIDSISNPDAITKEKIDAFFNNDPDAINKKESVSSKGTVSTDATSSGTQDSTPQDPTLAYWTGLLRGCPVLRDGLNKGRAGPRILTAANWTYSKNVLFELLAQADELELWGLSDQSILEQCATRAHDGGSHPDGPGMQPDAPLSTHLSYYYLDGPRVALSERVLLAERERASKGLLQTIVHSRVHDMQLSLWTPKKQHSRDVHGQLLQTLKANAFRGGQADKQRPRRSDGGYPSEPAKINTRSPTRFDAAPGVSRPFRSEPP